jgi:hypothetical protein
LLRGLVCAGGATGVRDPAEISELAIELLGVGRLPSV